MQLGLHYCFSLDRQWTQVIARASLLLSELRSKEMG